MEEKTERDEIVMGRLSLQVNELQLAVQRAKLIHDREMALRAQRLAHVEERNNPADKSHSHHELRGDNANLPAASRWQLVGTLLDFLEERQLGGVALAVMTLAACALCWGLFMPIRMPEILTALGPGAVVLAVGMNATYLRLKVPFVKNRRDGWAVPPDSVLSFKHRLRKAWPKGRPELAEEDSSELHALRAELIRELAGMDYDKAGALVTYVLHSSRKKDLAACYALLDYIEESPFLRRLFDAVRGYADGSLYEQYTSEEVQHWIADRVTERSFEAEWKGWTRERRVFRSAKRLADIVAAAALLAVFTFVVPVIPVLVVLLRLEPSEPPLPIIMKTLRVGRLGKPFTYFRFRARIARMDDGTFVIGPISRILLLTGLDKAPALVNVLIGDMSLVGPHPLHWCHYQQVTRQGVDPDLWLRRLRVKPGLTGPSQVTALRSPATGYRCVDYLERDARYASSQDFMTDACLLARQASYSLLAIWQAVRTSPESVLRTHSSGI